MSGCDLDRIARLEGIEPELAMRLAWASDFWIFAYGSLMWEPGFAYCEAVPAMLRGYHRQILRLFAWLSRHARAAGTGPRPRPRRRLQGHRLSRARGRCADGAHLSLGPRDAERCLSPQGIDRRHPGRRSDRGGLRRRALACPLCAGPHRAADRPAHPPRRRQARHIASNISRTPRASSSVSAWSMPRSTAWSVASDRWAMRRSRKRRDEPQPHFE